MAGSNSENASPIGSLAEPLLNGAPAVGTHKQSLPARALPLAP